MPFTVETLTFASSLSVDFAGVDRYVLTLTGACEITALANVPPEGCQLVVSHSGGPHAFTLPADVQRPVGETLAPHATGRTVYSLATVGDDIYVARDHATGWEANAVAEESEAAISASLAAFVATAVATIGDVVNATVTAELSAFEAAAEAAIGGETPLPLTYGADLRLWFKAAPANVTVDGGVITAAADLGVNGNNGTAWGDPRPSLTSADSDWDGHDSVAFVFADENLIEFPGVVGAGWDPSAGVTFTVPFTAEGGVSFETIAGFFGNLGFGAPKLELFREGDQIKIVSDNGTSDVTQTVLWDYDGDPEVLTIVATPATLVGDAGSNAGVDVAGTINVYRNGSSTPLATFACHVTLRDFTTFWLGAQMNGGYATDSRLTGSIPEGLVINQALSASDAADINAFVRADKVA